MARTRLPKRRPGFALDIEAHNQAFTVTFGPERKIAGVLEVFVDAHKRGSDTDASLSDIGKFISLALQTGAVSLQDMAATAVRDSHGKPLGLPGIVVDAVIAECAE